MTLSFQYNHTMPKPIQHPRSRTTVLVIALLAAMIGLSGLFALSQSVQAASPRQAPIYTPTPGPDGKIIYVVKANDTLLGISLVMGVSIDQLRALNNLTDDTIIEGQNLIIGLGGPPEVTPAAGETGPTATPAPLTPTPTPQVGSGKLCILLFNDENGDSIRQEQEISIPDGAISISNRTGSVSRTDSTKAGTEAQCFEDLPEGEYTISVAAPAGYNATTANSYALPLKAGDQTYIDFGAQVNSVTAAESPALVTETGKRSPLLAIIGGVFLLAGVAVAVMAGRLLRR